jgi:hypothetical protein
VTDDEADYESDEVYGYVALVRGQVVANSLDDAAAAARMAVVQDVEATLYVGAGPLERLPTYLRVAFRNYIAQRGLVAATGRLASRRSRGRLAVRSARPVTDRLEVETPPHIQISEPPLQGVQRPTATEDLPSGSL